MNNDTEKNDIEKLSNALADLDWDIQPKRDLWPDIESKLENKPSSDTRPDETKGANVVSISERASLKNTWMSIAIAACLVLTVCSLGFNYVAYSKLSEIQNLQVAANQAGSGLTAFRHVSQPSLVRQQILQLVKDKRYQIDSATLVEVETALRSFDQVYSEISNEIQGQPSNSELTYMLIEMYQQEAQLLEMLRMAREPSI